MQHNENTQKFRNYWLIIPLCCVASLLLGFANNKCSAASSATLTIGQNSLSTTVTQGDVAYLSSTITASGTDISNYTLTITGPVGLTGGSTITGAGDKTPSAMPNNSWGFSYNNSNANNAKTYKSFTGSAQTLETGTPNGNLTGTAKNITFAAKFASNATSAHYKANVTIGLVATPRALSTFTLTYDTNGGSTAPATQSCSTYDSSCSVTMSYNDPTKSSSTFLGWGDDTSSGAVNSVYGKSKTVQLSANKTIYAIWRSTYTLTYECNPPSGTDVTSCSNMPQAQTCTTTTGQCSITTSSQSPSPQYPTEHCGYTFYFSNWNTSADGSSASYEKSSTITINKNTTLYAHWQFNSGLIPC